MILSDFPKTIQGRVETPAVDHILIVREDIDRKLLDKVRVTELHHSVPQPLFATPCVGKDIHTSMAFLTTRVRRPVKDYWWKLKLLLQYCCNHDVFR